MVTDLGKARCCTMFRWSEHADDVLLRYDAKSGHVVVQSVHPTSTPRKEQGQCDVRPRADQRLAGADEKHNPTKDPLDRLRTTA